MVVGSALVRRLLDGGGPDEAAAFVAEVRAALDTVLSEVAADRNVTHDCDLCEAARITPWFHEDDLCWIAECEICAVPMVVWREHDATPPADVKAALHERLAAVVDEHFDVRALRRRQHAQHPRPLPRARPAARRLLRARPQASGSAGLTRPYRNSM